MQIRKAKIVRLLMTAAAIVGVAVFRPGPTLGQQPFDSPALAAEAFVDALATKNTDTLGSILGSDWKDFIPTDEISQEDVDAFLAAWDKSHTLKPDTQGRMHLAVGPDEWTLPIPLVKHGETWHFDPQAGADKMRTRRIGRNELAALQATLAYYDAQKEYALADRNGDGMLEYAQKLLSTPGQRDGLFWPTQAGEPESPLGPLFGDDKPGTDYHGYFFKILKEQGPHASGGAYDYRLNGRMSAGFALVAWPVVYGDSGVMTFLISHDGQGYEKDLGPDTEASAPAMTRFDPDSEWQKVSP